MESSENPVPQEEPPPVTQPQAQYRPLTDTREQIHELRARYRKRLSLLLTVKLRRGIQNIRDAMDRARARLQRTLLPLIEDVWRMIKDAVALIVYAFWPFL